jgi:hypothetical protein
MTPSSCSKTASVHQKQPVPKVAVSALPVKVASAFPDVFVVFIFKF